MSKQGRAASGAAVLGAVAMALAAGAAPASAAHGPDDDSVIGPSSYKGLHLGQPEPQAEASGLLVDRDASGPCHFYRLRPEEGRQNVGSGVFIDPAKGVVMIGGTDRTRTPQGVGMGSTLAQARLAYPDLKPVGATGQVFRAEVPGNPGMFFRFAFDPAKAYTVSDFGMESGDMGSC